jgi:hypothetical protein
MIRHEAIYTRQDPIILVKFSRNVYFFLTDTHMNSSEDLERFLDLLVFRELNRMHH